MGAVPRLTYLYTFARGLKAAVAVNSLNSADSTFVIASYTWKAVSDRDTLEDLSQSPRSPSNHDRKLLILNGEMSEWSIEHAWKIDSVARC